MHTEARFHYIDNLRCIALLLGVIFHAALAYGPYFSNIWFTADPNNHVAFNYFAIWTHLFRMPVFFVIAGFCAALLIHKRTGNPFIINRLKRVLLPLIIFLPITLIIFLHAIHWAEQITTSPPALFSVFKVVKEPILTTMHLWFLWNLIQFCILLWVLNKFKNTYQILLSLVVKPPFLCGLLPIIVTLAMSQQMVPFPAPDKVLPQLWSFGFYGVLFFIGAGLFHHNKYIAEYYKRIHLLAFISVISLIAYFYILPAPVTLEKVIEAASLGQLIPDTIDVLAVIIQTIAILSWTATALLVGYRWLNKQNLVSRYLSDASYWIYLIHVPLLIYIQLPLINFAISPFIKLLISVFATLTIGIVSYHYLVRHSMLGVLLNGKKIDKITKIHHQKSSKPQL